MLILLLLLLLLLLVLLLVLSCVVARSLSWRSCRRGRAHDRAVAVAWSWP